MTRDEIIRMAREAGIPIETDWAGRPSTLVIKDGGTYLRGVDDLERFAALVAAAAKPQPLPEDQLWKSVDEGQRAFFAGWPGTSWTLCVARAIEAAHGIGGEE